MTAGFTVTPDVLLPLPGDDARICLAAASAAASMILPSLTAKSLEVTGEAALESEREAEVAAEDLVGVSGCCCGSWFRILGSSPSSDGGGEAVGVKTAAWLEMEGAGGGWRTRQCTASSTTSSTRDSPLFIQVGVGCLRATVLM